MSITAPLLMCLAAGCSSLPQQSGFVPPWKKAAKPDAPKDSISLTAGRGMISEPMDPKSRQELDVGRRLFEDGKYAEAERVFHKIASADDVPWWDFGLFDRSGQVGAEAKWETRRGKKMYQSVLEEAIFYEAECQRLQKNFRGAEETYTKLLVAVPHSQYVQRTCKGMFEIAHVWLKPTKDQMDEYQDQIEGKRWFITPASYVHFTREMPFLDAEGRAINVLNTIRLHDINGPMGEKALVYLGTINFFRKEYKEADFYFTELYQKYPNSDKAALALKQSIICKQLMTGGTVYDQRTVEESKKLLMVAQGAYPEFNKEENQKWVEHQLKGINIQQADRDFKIAEFYQRTGHPGSAYFYYELVCRRYPNTTYAAQAQQRKTELRGNAEREYQQQDAPLIRRPAGDSLLQPGTPIEPPPRTLPPGLQ
jgi:outer membrane protein assembly factor BamD (BamD/ComL family)